MLRPPRLDGLEPVPFAELPRGAGVVSREERPLRLGDEPELLERDPEVAPCTTMIGERGDDGLEERPRGGRASELEGERRRGFTFTDALSGASRRSPS